MDNNSNNDLLAEKLEQIASEIRELRATMEMASNISLLAKKKILTLDDVALLTGLTKRYIYTLTCRRKIPFYKPNRGMIYFERSEIDAWLRRNKYEAEND